MVLRVLITGVLLIHLPSLATQREPAHPPVVDLPRAAVRRIPSPNKNWTLIFERPNDSSQRQLWIEENTPHTRRLVKEYDRSLRISSAPHTRMSSRNQAS